MVNKCTKFEVSSLSHFSHVTVTIFVTVWPWPLTFCLQGQCMPSDCHWVYVYQVWCW